MRTEEKELFKAIAATFARVRPVAPVRLAASQATDP
jgi:hypothetical protein